MAAYTGCFKKSFTTLKAYRNLYRGHTQRLELSKCSKTHRVLPRIVIRNCFDLLFRFLLYGTSIVTPTPKSNEHVQIHDTFHARGTVVPNTATASAPAFEIIRSLLVYVWCTVRNRLFRTVHHTYIHTPTRVSPTNFDTIHFVFIILLLGYLAQCFSLRT